MAARHTIKTVSLAMLALISLLIGCKGSSGVTTEARQLRIDPVASAPETEEQDKLAPKKTGTLQVPGASLYYEVLGSGPTLLIIAGGSGDADSSDKIVHELTANYTVVTYDRRGYARSKIDNSADALRMEMESDDAHHLLAALGTRPASVLGSSIGAVIALDLAVRYPDQVGTVIAHEPPAIYLTSSQSEGQRSQGGSIQDIKDRFQREGADAAMKEFAGMVGVNDLPTGSTQTGEQRTANVKFFLDKEVPMLARYRFDFDALKGAMTRTRLVIGVGSASPKDSVGYLGAEAVTDRLGIGMMEFPGDHAGMERYPKEFAEKLRGLLGNRIDK